MNKQRPQVGEPVKRVIERGYRVDSQDRIRSGPFQEKSLMGDRLYANRGTVSKRKS